MYLRRHRVRLEVGCPARRFGFASGRKHPVTVTVIAFQSGRCGGMFQPGPLRNLHGSGGQMAYKMVDLKHFHI